MYMLINALLIALLVLPVGAAREANNGPLCRAELKGSELITRVELLSGISVEGPWRVMHHDGGAAGASPAVMRAQLNHVVETDALTGERVLTRFPHPIQLTFEGETEAAMMRRAAQTWCITVMRAQQRQLRGPAADQRMQSWIAEA